MYKKRKAFLIAFLIYYFLFFSLISIFSGKINSILMFLIFNFISILIIILIILKINNFKLYIFLFFTSFLSFLFSTFLIIMISFGDSMIPTHYDKSILLLYQNKFDIKRYDVVAVEFPEKWGTKYRINFKRIVGIPGDEIIIKENYLYINENKIWYWDQALADILVGIEDGKIKEDYYFVLGDNYHMSLDSRYVGMIHRSKIHGKLMLIIYKGKMPKEDMVYSK